MRKTSVTLDLLAPSPSAELTLPEPRPLLQLLILEHHRLHPAPGLSFHFGSESEIENHEILQPGSTNQDLLSGRCIMHFKGTI